MTGCKSGEVRNCKTFAQKFENTIGAAFNRIPKMPIRRGLLADFNTANMTNLNCPNPMHVIRARPCLPPHRA
jgi:hypothetical protein